MSKERARRREAREAEAAVRAEARATADVKAIRRRARRTAFRRRFAPILPGGRTGQQTGVLASRRRVRLNLIFTALLFIQILVWIVRPDWQARLGALVIAILAFPVVLAFAL